MLISEKGVALDVPHLISRWGTVNPPAGLSCFKFKYALAPSLTLFSSLFKILILVIILTATE